MASMTRYLFALGIIALLAAVGPPLGATEIAPELPDPAAVRAYENYWSNFDAYEKKLLERGNDKYQKAWNELQAQSDRLQAQASAEQIRHLKAAADRYRDHLSEHSAAD